MTCAASLLLRRTFSPGQHPPDVPEIRRRSLACRRALRQFVHSGDGPRFVITKLDPRQVQQLVHRQDVHGFLLVSAAPIAASEEATAPDEADASLATGTQWRSAVHLQPQAEAGAIWPEEAASV